MKIATAALPSAGRIQVTSAPRGDLFSLNPRMT